MSKNRRRQHDIVTTAKTQHKAATTRSFPATCRRALTTQTSSSSSSSSSDHHHHHHHPVQKKINVLKPMETTLIKSQFRSFYDRGDLPLRVNFSGAMRKIQWQVDLAQLDYAHYLPIFFEGLCETEEPYQFLALEGCMDLLERGGNRSLRCVPHLIRPMKRNLLTKIPSVLIVQMKALKQLVIHCPYAGEALVPYYRQFLLTFNLFLTHTTTHNSSDLDAAAAAPHGIGGSGGSGSGSSGSIHTIITDMMMDTLYILEKYGGEDAFVNLKYMIPTYESSSSCSTTHAKKNWR